jgi:hypothetical protein
MEAIASKLNAFSFKRGIVVLFCALTIGCAASEPRYFWGDYEDLIYQMYIEPGSADSTIQIAKLQDDIGKAGAEGKPVPPGLHGHLGYMYLVQGDTHNAVLEFETEKRLFPESTQFIDGLMGHLKK